MLYNKSTDFQKQTKWKIDDCRNEINEIKEKLIREVNYISTETYFDPDSIVTYANKLSIVQERLKNLMDTEMILNIINNAEVDK